MESKPSKNSDDKKKSSKPKTVPKEKKTKTPKAKKPVKGKIGGAICPEPRFNTTCTKVKGNCINPNCCRPNKDKPPEINKKTREKVIIDKPTCCVSSSLLENGSEKYLYTCQYCGDCTTRMYARDGRAIEGRVPCRENAKGNNGNAKGNTKRNTKY